MRRTKLKVRILSWVLSFLMAFSAVPTYAAEIVSGNDAIVGTVSGNDVTVKSVSGNDGIAAVSEQAPAKTSDTKEIVLDSGVTTSKEMKRITFKNLTGSAPQEIETNTYEIILDPSTDPIMPVEIEMQWTFAKSYLSKNYLVITNGTDRHYTATKLSDSTKNPPVYPYEQKGNLYTVIYNTAVADSGVNYFVPAWEDVDGTLQATLQFGYVSKNTATAKINNPVTVILKIGTGEVINNQPTVVGDVEKKETINKNEERTFDITEKFVDPEGAPLSYFYSIDSDKEEDYLPLPDGKLTMVFTKDYTTNADYVLRFKAFDGEKYSKAYTVSINVVNQRPVLNAGVTDQTISVLVNEQIEIDWSDAFSDPNNDPLTYRVAIDGTLKFRSYEETKYNCVYGTPGTYIFEIRANDGGSYFSDKTYKVTVKVTEPEADVPNFDVTYDVTVNIPETLIPQFHITKTAGYNAVDTYHYDLLAEAGETLNGFTEWTVKVPDNISRISYRAQDAEGKKWGGMSIITKAEDGTITEPVTLRPLKGLIKTRIDGEALTEELAEFKVKTYEGSWVENGDSDIENGYLYYRFLLTAYDNEATYTYYAVPKGDLTSIYSEAVADFNPITPDSAETDVYPLPFNLASGFTIIAPKDADVKVFNQERYYKAVEQPCLGKETRNDTCEWHFAKIGTGANMSYRVSMEGKITKIGYVTGDSITITWDEEDTAPNGRVDYDLSTTYGKRAEDSIYLNVNGQNHLALDVNESFVLRPFRIWQLVNSEVDNIMIEPDFTYSVVSGEDVISVASVNDYNMNAVNNRLQVVAKENGVAILEIGYDAVAFAGGDEAVYEGNGWEKTFQGKMTYGAVDPARAGMVVVQVGNVATDVNFGIQFSDAANRAWDAEHDTVYFLGEKGQISFCPTVNSGSVCEVAVSNDKGANWDILTAENGLYCADIVSGNNIIRVRKSDNTEAYQVVRGDKLTVTLYDENKNGKVEAGEEIKIHISGMNFPAGKMSGIYNPGGVTTSYAYDGKTVSNQTLQYQCSQTSLVITVPKEAEDGAEIRLANGKTLAGWMGDPIGSHREITDSGKNMNGTALSRNYSFNLMPDIVFAVGGDAAEIEQEPENRVPVRKNDVPETGGEVSIKVGEIYKLPLSTIFEDPDGDTLSFKASMNGAVAEVVSKNYSFVPTQEGIYTLVFTANDGKADSADIYTVTIKVEGVVEKAELEFNLEENEIAGWVTISFEDNGIRPEEELKDIDVIYRTPLGNIIEATQVPFAEYDTIASVTIRLLDAMGMYAGYNGTEYSGFYLTSIGKFIVNESYYETFGEKHAGDGSGWMVTLSEGGTGEEWFINRGANAFVVGDGDIIKWKYTCQIGADIRDSIYDEAIDAVERLIDAIGSPVTFADEEKIQEARQLYDELPDDSVKSKVENYNKLEAAERALAQLKASEADRAAADAVDKLIDEIGEVTIESEEKISAARAAYEDLTETQKHLVENTNKLIVAENLLVILKNPSHKEIWNATGNYMETLGTPYAGPVGGDWMALGLARSGRTVPAGYYDNVVAYIKENMNADGQLHWYKSTENSRVILGLTAIGRDVTNVDGYNLLEALTDMEYVKKQGINGPIWALIAFDSHDYEIPAGGDVTREGLVAAILAAQLADSGWALSGSVSDPDMTGMAIQALAPYYGTNAEVKAAVDKALDYLSAAQSADGSYSSVDGSNIESCAQVIVALTALGINPETDSRFVKNGISVVDALCNFAVKDGGFKHTADGKLDGMATEQGYYALAAYMRFLEGKTALYDMSDVTLSGDNDGDNGDGSTGGNNGDSTGGNTDGAEDNTDDSTEDNTGDSTGGTSGDSTEGNTGDGTADNSAADNSTAESTENKVPAVSVKPSASSKPQVFVELLEALDLKSKPEEILNAILAYEELSKEEKEDLQSDEQVEELRAQLAEMLQTDDETGISVVGAEWNIQLAVEAVMHDDEVRKAQEKLNGHTILGLCDIYLKDVLTGKKVQPDGSVQIKIPLALLGDYSAFDGLAVVHYADDGTVEYLNCTMDEEYIAFNTIEFSYYAVVGYVGASPLDNLNDDVISDDMKTDSTSALPWVIGGGCGLLLLAVILFLIMKNKKVQA